MAAESDPRGALRVLTPWVKPPADVLPFPSLADAPARSSALPRGWAKAWERNDARLAGIRDSFEELAAGIATRDERAYFSDLVWSTELADHPIHRWYSYKEAYSPQLPIEVIHRVGAGRSG